MVHINVKISQVSFFVYDIKTITVMIQAYSMKLTTEMNSAPSYRDPVHTMVRLVVD